MVNAGGVEAGSRWMVKVLLAGSNIITTRHVFEESLFGVGSFESSDFTPAASLPPFKLSSTTTSCVLIYRMLPSSILRQGAVSYITRSQFHDALLHACPSLADASPLRPPKLGRGYRLFSTTI
jgi:hypothetical protein